MCCSPTSKDVARAAPMILDEASKDVIAPRPPTNRFSRPSPCSARPLAVRRPSAPKQSQARVSREDLDLVRLALEQELAAGVPLSDVEIVDHVSSSRSKHHPLVVSIGESTPVLLFFCPRGFLCFA